MRLLSRIFLAIAILLVLTGLQSDPALAQDADYPADSTLIRISTNWLELLDTGNPEQAFEEAAPLLQRMAGSAAGWERFLAQARPVPADSVSRDLIGIERDPDIPGAPEGRYVTVAFATDHPEMPAESVVLLETDDGWKVSMYMLRTPEALAE